MSVPFLDLGPGYRELQVELDAPWRRVIAQTVGTEWDGTDLPNGTLLIEQRIRDIGAPLRHARLVCLAGRRVGRCIALVDPRLASLFDSTRSLCDPVARSMRHRAQTCD